MAKSKNIEKIARTFEDDERGKTHKLKLSDWCFISADEAHTD